MTRQANTICKNLIAVLEEPNFIMNIGNVIRNVNALGVEKLYVVDSKKRLEDNLEEMRKRKSLLKHSVSAIKWTEVNRFNSTEECLQQLEKDHYTSVVTSPYIKGKKNAILHEGVYTQEKLAVWFGNESDGISNLAIEKSELCIQMEMFGQVDSLNLATSTGIVLYEITKQRRLANLVDLK
ncbi:TrmH family RNA methyltransferase [Sediminitomix flava]|uniref:tRNA (Guanosine-2'-O-)-methyltransferase n=1 Tax=Sediminitomix flava TaxID=379075 RepID=A0A315ZDV7_SEDFL|nr:TrmH family RNA methyltransferase [Sediminitomix flava]PWJ43008.1 tRNA (guanosine-2'-O-)-methyltransferase [Sediminitomix flava]